MILFLLAVAERQRDRETDFPIYSPKLQQGHSDSHTVTRPAFILMAAGPTIWANSAEAKQNRLHTFGHAQSASAPFIPQAERG